MENRVFILNRDSVYLGYIVVQLQGWTETHMKSWSFTLPLPQLSLSLLLEISLLSYSLPACFLMSLLF